MTEQAQALSIIDLYAEQRNLTRDDLVVVLMKTIMPRDKSGNELATKADMIGFLQIAHRYDLDPWAREIYCIVSRGKVLPYISIDGYAKIVNRQPAYDGCEFDYEQNADGQFLSVTCTMYHKDRSRPVRVTEFMSECYKPDSDAWKRNPARMLRHRAFIQAARLSFAIAGGLDEDTADAMIDVTPAPPQAVIEKPATPKAPPQQKAPPASQQSQDAGYRSFADDAGKEQQRKDGPDEQAPADERAMAGADQKAQAKTPPKTKAKAPPAAANNGGEETKPSMPAGSGHRIEEHDKPDVEEFVNELNDRLNEAQNVEQLTEIWADMNPAATIMPAPGGEALMRYAQSIFDKREKKLKESK